MFVPREDPAQKRCVIMKTSLPPPAGDYEITGKDAERVTRLIRRASSKQPENREKRIDNWSDDDKQLFVNVSSQACSYGKFAIDEALLPLDMDEIHSLLRQFYHSYRESPTMFIKWFSAEKSFKAMSTCVPRGELMSYMDDVFGGRDKWLHALLTSKGNTIKEAFQSPDMFAVSFPYVHNFIPVKYITYALTPLKTYQDIIETPKLLDSVVKSVRHYLKMGGVTARLVQDKVFGHFNWPRKKTYGEDDIGYTILTSIYTTGVSAPSSDSWTKLIFGGGIDLCNTSYDDWRDAGDDEYGIYEIPFCEECSDFYESDNSCICAVKLHPRECQFLMERGVQIPDEFWERCAYHNLWHFAHHLHAYRPESFPMNIPIGAFKKALRFDKIAFAKFLVQYKYFSLSDVPRDAQISTKMHEMLGVGTKKQRRDEIMTAQSVLDEFKQDMPENTYLELCKRYKDCFD